MPKPRTAKRIRKNPVAGKNSRILNRLPARNASPAGASKAQVGNAAKFVFGKICAEHGRTPQSVMYNATQKNIFDTDMPKVDYYCLLLERFVRPGLGPEFRERISERQKPKKGKKQRPRRKASKVSENELVVRPRISGSKVIKIDRRTEINVIVNGRNLKAGKEAGFGVKVCIYDPKRKPPILFSITKPIGLQYYLAIDYSVSPVRRNAVRDKTANETQRQLIQIFERLRQ